MRRARRIRLLLMQRRLLRESEMDTQKPLTMPPVIGGPGADGDLPDQKPRTMPPVIGGPGSDGGMPTERPLTLPPVI